MGIPAKYVESQMQFWEILSEMKSTHLAVDLCVLLPCVEEKNQLISLFQKCKSLQALKYMVCSCDRCASIYVSVSYQCYPISRLLSTWSSFQWMTIAVLEPCTT